MTAEGNMELSGVQTETLSDILRSALDSNEDGRVTVGEIADRVQERGYGLFLILLSLPMLIPMPFVGPSAPIGLVIALLGLQLLVGRSNPWLPQSVRNYQLPPKIVAAMQIGGVKVMERVEKLSRPRWRFMHNPVCTRLVALAMILTGIVLFLPLPGVNTPPALLMIMVGVGMLNRDGLFLLLGISLCTGLVIALVVAAIILWDRVVPYAMQYLKWIPWLKPRA